MQHHNTFGDSSLIAANQSTALGPAKLRITPYRVTEVLDRKIFEFWKFGCAPTSFRAAANDPKVSRQFAYLCFFRGKNIFQMGFYPHADQPQVIKDLPMDQLPQAVADLLGAGFGTKGDQQIFQHPVPEKILGETPKLVSNKTLQERDLPG